MMSSEISALHTDLYQLTMMQGYHATGNNPEAVFDLFFRQNPFGGGYSVFAGLHPVLEIVENLRFSESDIVYLKSTGLFQDDFLSMLRDFRFQGDIYAFEEGSIIFPQEPVLRVHASILEAQLIETISLNIINYQSLIATKASRIFHAGRQKPLLEFGLRRAHGVDGALSATRAALIGGAESTSNVAAGKEYSVPVRGTMAHSWVMAFGNEAEAFEKYAELYPHNTILLVDTYNTLESGIPEAIGVLRKLKEKGINNFGIRLDSGDMEYLTKEARRMLDDAGLVECKILVSNDLDEFVIQELESKNSPIDAYGVGTRLITGDGSASFGGVYKLAAIKSGGLFLPRLKVSNNMEKTTNPGIKNVYRLEASGNYLADLMALEEESENIIAKFNKKEPVTFYHPASPFEKKIYAHYESVTPMLRKRMEKGKRLQSAPGIVDIRKTALSNLEKVHPSVKRFLNPHVYKVSASEKLSRLKFQMVENHSG